MNEHARTLIASQSHRQMVDPMSLRRWAKQQPFAIERATTVPVEPKKAEASK